MCWHYQNWVNICHASIRIWICILTIMLKPESVTCCCNANAGEQETAGFSRNPLAGSIVNLASLRELCVQNQGEELLRKILEVKLWPLFLYTYMCLRSCTDTEARTDKHTLTYTIQTKREGLRYTKVVKWKNLLPRTNTQFPLAEEMRGKEHSVITQTNPETKLFINLM